MVEVGRDGVEKWLRCVGDQRVQDGGGGVINVVLDELMVTIVGVF